MNRSIRKERWKDYDYSDMALFQKNRILERDMIFGKKDVALKLTNQTSNSSTLNKEKPFLTDSNVASEKEKTNKIVKIGETFL